MLQRLEMVTHKQRLAGTPPVLIDTITTPCITLPQCSGTCLSSLCHTPATSMLDADPEIVNCIQAGPSLSQTANIRCQTHGPTA